MQNNKYEIPWRPNYEAAAAATWLASAFASVAAPWATGLFAPPFIAAAAIAGFMTIRRARQARRLHVRKAGLSGKKLHFIKLSELRKFTRDENIWLGYGFTWDQPQTQLAFDLQSRDKRDLLPKNTAQMGASWLHGLSLEEQHLHLPIDMTKGHLLVVGTTGSGKTRLFDLLISQAIMRGEPVIIIDPKGDQELAANARRACEAMGQGDRYIWFHPAFPERSARIDPMRNYARATELAARIAGQMPSEGPGDPFKSYSQMALNNVIQGLLLTGHKPSILAIRTYLEGGTEALVIKSVEVWCDAKLGAGWQDNPAAKRYLQQAKTPTQRAHGLIQFYRTYVHETAPNHDLEGLLSMFEHDRTHFGKMIASLLPLLGQLTSGHMGAMLSPDPADHDDPRPIVDMASVIKQRSVCYIGLDSLADPMVGSAIGAIMLSDLAAVASEIYNFSPSDSIKPVNIFVDEAAEVVNDPLIQLLNKGRGAGIRVLIATQTLADLEARLGSPAKARQVLGNVNNIIALRVTDNDTQTYITEGLPTVRVKYVMTTQASNIGTGGHETMQFSGGAGERLMEEEAEVLPAWMLGRLPNLEYFARVAGGEIWKGRLPILTG
jgi:conjugal transfer pilus assembly protein TraD